LCAFGCNTEEVLEGKDTIFATGNILLIAQKYRVFPLNNGLSAHDVQLITIIFVLINHEIVTLISKEK